MGMKTPKSSDGTMVSYKGETRRRDKRKIQSDIQLSINSAIKPVFIGNLLCSYTSNNKNYVKLLKVSFNNINSLYTNDDTYINILKIKVLLEIMKSNIEFIEQIINTKELPKESKDLKYSGYLLKKPGVNLSNYNYESFMQLIQKQFGFSSKLNPDYTSNDKILSKLLKDLHQHVSEQITNKKPLTLSKEKFLELSGQIREVLNKNASIYKAINNDDTILQDFYSKYFPTSNESKENDINPEQ